MRKNLMVFSGWNVHSVDSSLASYKAEALMPNSQVVINASSCSSWWEPLRFLCSPATTETEAYIWPIWPDCDWSSRISRIKNISTPCLHTSSAHQPAGHFDPGLSLACSKRCRSIKHTTLIARPPFKQIPKTNFNGGHRGLPYCSFTSRRSQSCHTEPV